MSLHQEIEEMEIQIITTSINVTLTFVLDLVMQFYQYVKHLNHMVHLKLASHMEGRLMTEGKGSLIHIA